MEMAEKRVAMVAIPFKGGGGKAAIGGGGSGGEDATRREEGVGPGSDWRGTARERERGEGTTGSGRARRRETRARVGRPGNKNGVGRARMNSDDFQLFKLISNELEWF
jgi:hypothetical protein